MLMKLKAVAMENIMLKSYDQNVIDSKAEQTTKLLMMDSPTHTAENRYYLVPKVIEAHTNKRQISLDRMFQNVQAINGQLDSTRLLNVNVNEFKPLASYGTTNSTNISNVDVTQIILAGQHQQCELIDAIRLPTTQFLLLDGDPLRFWSFIRTFYNVMEMDDINSSSKLIHLVHACTERVKKVIKCCVVMHADAGYKRARELLWERFGDKFMIANAWISNVTLRRAIKANERDKLQEFADELKSCYETLPYMKYLGEADNQSVLLHIMEQLPNYLQQRFKRKFRISESVKDEASSLVTLSPL